MLHIADDYERLARRAEERLKKRAVEAPPQVSLMSLFTVSFGGQDQPFDCEAIKNALILGIRQVLRPREAHCRLGSKLLRLRRKLEHLC
jgi:hypothetical protein